IGINSSIATISSDFMQSGSIGLGFAIPINLVSNIASQLVENGTAVHPLLGVTSDNSVTEVDGQLRAGAEIQSVSSGSPADAAGLLEGDVIYAVDSVPITGMISLTATIRSYQPGATVKLSVSRDGEGVELEATLTTREN
ncbi:MAG: S1C family serine protease, partial [Micrococcales bacterium]|nr:S1C family serine protease [Micrococcales bacterium]